jgi:uncharacterized metal-binding protein YceD (DUF177 family)
MKLSEFDIDFIKFKNEKDQFHYKLNNEFFGLKENSLYHSGDIDVAIVCERNENTISVDYTFDGFVAAECERCLDDIKLEVTIAYNELIKLTPNESLLAEENYISINHPVYNVYDTLYEQICLSIPLRRICENSTKNQECKIDHLSTSSDEHVEDERWAQLKKLIK